ncbi:MAG TPA: hypothetical protein VFY83_12945 [Anaerolineales bacterium]|nr:hypothetical protein [Anaerolineales bacterium]
MNIYLVWLLRIIHIVAGVFWVGGILIMTFFVGPTVGATGEAGQKFVAHLMNNLKFSNRMAAASGLTILAGLILYFRGGTAFFESPFGIGLGIGAVFALIGFVSGMFIGRTIKAMAQLGAQMQGKPSPDQLRQMQALQKRQMTVSMISTISVLLATVFMAIARYL